MKKLLSIMTTWHIFISILFTAITGVDSKYASVYEEELKEKEKGEQ